MKRCYEIVATSIVVVILAMVGQSSARAHSSHHDIIVSELGNQHVAEVSGHSSEKTNSVRSPLRVPSHCEGPCDVSAKAVAVSQSRSNRDECAFVGPSFCPVPAVIQLSQMTDSVTIDPLTHWSERPLMSSHVLALTARLRL